MKEQFPVTSEASDVEEEKEKPPLKIRIYLAVTSLIKKIKNSVIIGSSLLLGGFMILIESIILGYLAHVTKDGRVNSESAFYIGVFLFFFIPAFILFGIPLISSNKNHAQKMLWVPTLCILIPLFITIPITDTLYEDPATESVATYMVLAPSLTIIFWITLYYLGLKRRKTKFGLVPFIFICFMIPLVYLQPMISNHAYKNDAVARGFSILFLV